VNARRSALLALAVLAACAREVPPVGAPPPGAPPRDAAVVRRLRQAWDARPPGYAPRTRHRRPDGTPRWTNRLFLETSPYLLQHAHNPVEWYPWGEEAFATARRLGRPVLLSIGYATCHWCHVMEEESFEDEEVARSLNEHYVAVKVDREERPDVDAVYMDAVRTLTGGGGWPMTVWLTADRRPFYGGTYFPPRDGDRGVRVGFLSLLTKLRQVHADDPARVAEAAASLAAQVRANLAPAAGAGAPPGPDALARAAAYCRATFDAEHGGQRRVPKFPSNLPVRFLLRHHRRTGDAEALRMATVTLERMAAGGLRDHVGGGFHRYATDARWLVPHFEKTLYDNALLVVAYLEAYQATGRADLADVAREVLGWVERDMTSPEGAFFAATDADSEAPGGARVEGWFFTWTPAELEAALGAEAARVVAAYHGVVPAGHLDGRSILHVPRPLDAVAAELGVEAAALARRLADARERLRAARARRPAPLRDEKIVAAWNGLMISAHARAALALDEPRWAERAARAADFLLRRLRRDGRLLRSWKDGRAEQPGYLEDHAFVVAGLLDLHEATGELRWLRAATELDAVLAARFEDRDAGGYFRTSHDHEALLAREKPAVDGAEPSGNSVQALNLLRLHVLTADDAYRRRAERALAVVGSGLAAEPGALSEMLLALDFHLDAPKEIVIATPASRAEAEPFLARLRRRFVPNRILAVSVAGDGALAAAVPVAGGKPPVRGRATAYVCERRVCDLPTTDPEEFARQVTRSPRDPVAGRSGGER
jgi:uncharacterized protein YyaL (SSP411 family)